jgi:hypothetical protein
MTLKGIAINRTIAEARRALEKDVSVSPGFRALVEALLCRQLNIPLGKSRICVML